MIESRPIVPQNDGWLEVRVPKNIMDDLWGMIETAGRDAKFKLAGNISARAPGKLKYFGWDHNL